MFKNIKSSFSKCKGIDRITYLVVAFTIICIPLIRLLSFSSFKLGLLDSIFSFDVSKIFYFLLPITIMIYIYNILKRKIKINCFDYIIYVLIFLAIISTIFAVNPYISIFGENIRGEGLITISFYYMLFLNIKHLNNKETIKGIVDLLFIVGIVHFIYAVLQSFTNLEIIRRYTFSHMASGLVTNPNFFGSYMSMLASLALGLYLSENNKKYLILLIIFFISIILAQSTGPFLGFALTFILVLLYNILKKRNLIKKQGLLMLGLVVIFFGVSFSLLFIHSKVFKYDIEPNYTIIGDLFNIEPSYENYSYGSGRLGIWRSTIPLIKDYYLTGSGLDCFGYVYPQNVEGVYFDKAHNVYLQILVTNGAFAFVFYLLLLLLIFIKGIKLKSSLGFSLLLAFITYSIQAFVNISVVDVAPIYFMICAFILALKE